VRRSIGELLAAARARLSRVTPADAAAAVAEGALLVDIRPTEQRARDGVIPGALIIDRNVLEWRLDPASPDRITEAGTYDRHIMIICDQGYASSLAAATLQELGLDHATDVIGGFQAWRDEGRPVTEP
jgi:rhodanese-related sulfurtransferase